MNFKKAVGLLGTIVLIGSMVFIGNYRVFIDPLSIIILVLLAITTYIAKYQTFKFDTQFWSHCDKVILPLGALMSTTGIILSLALEPKNLLSAIAVSLLAFFYSLVIKILL